MTNNDQSDDDKPDKVVDALGSLESLVKGLEDAGKSEDEIVGSIEDLLRGPKGRSH